MITRLVIARHGNTFGPGDVVTRVGGRTDLPLVDSGREQGRQIGNYLRQQGLVPDLVYTSNLQRTAQTAEAAGFGANLQPLDIFNEIDYGPDENQPEEKVLARLGEDALKAWDREGLVPNGWKVDPAAIIKNWKDFAGTLLQDHTGKTALVVTSNGIARFAPHIASNSDPDIVRAAHSIKIATGAVCLFEHDGTTWACKAWNLRPKDYLAA